MPTPPAYEVVIEDEQWAQIEALPHASQQERTVAFLMKYVSQTPTKRLSNGDLKELQGGFAGYWQYDIDRKYRLIYRVDEARKKVLVEYVGTHPAWGRGGGTRRIRS